MSTSVLSMFSKVKAFVFDVDGVLTDGSVIALENGEQARTFYIKDGWAIHHAIKIGFPLAIISAGRGSEGVRKRLEFLGVKHIWIGVQDKKVQFAEFLSSQGITAADVLYMGDDIPDVEVLKMVGLPTCPADASDDVLPICSYISPYVGGRGAVRDVIEKTLRVQGHWPVF